MKLYRDMNRSELEQELAALELEAKAIKAKGLKLDMARGKPSQEQVDLSRGLLDVLNSESDLTDGGGIVDNYGTPEGLPSARRLAAEIFGVEPELVLANGSSSLNLEYDCIAHAFAQGLSGEPPFCKQDDLIFLCPVPGYDRHFLISEHFGFKNLCIPTNEDGPDMELVRELVETNPKVKGIWCVPKYSNPTGITYSDEVVRAFAALKPAAPDFRIYWDNAYIVHGFSDTDDELLNIFELLEPDQNLVVEFGSTAKISFPGSGMAFMTASAQDLASFKSSFTKARVCSEKFSQLAHARYFKDLAGIQAHMAKQAELIAPKFRMVQEKLSSSLAQLDCSWTEPKGGYFVSFEAPEGTAKAIVAFAKELGVTLTPAGATYPGGADPKDSNIRLAPTYPNVEELSEALDVFCVAAKVVSLRHLLAQKV